MASSLVGAQLGPYRVTAPIGHGGMATVYRATQTTLDREVAVKVLSPTLTGDAEFVRRFEREARVVAGLHHPNILPIYDFGRDDDLFYIVTPYIDGGTLGDRGAPMPVAEAVGYVRQVAEGLAYAHDRGVIHRDIKPSNILLTREGRAVLADFGIARLVGDATRHTQTGQLVGTPTYISPEQARGGAASTQSDIYALGVVLYQLLEGRAPFESDSVVAVLYQHAHEPPPPPTRPDLPASVLETLARALAKSPADRFPSAAAFARALASDGSPPVTVPPSASRTVTETSAPKAPTKPIARPTLSARLPQRGGWTVIGAVVALAAAFVGIATVSTLPTTSGPSSQPAAPTTVDTASGAATPVPPAIATAQSAAATIQAGQAIAAATARAQATPGQALPTAAAPVHVGSGAIVVQNIGPTPLICSYNGESASTQVQAPSNSTQTISLPAGRYLERCVAPDAFGGGRVVEVTVTAGGTVRRVVP